MREGYPDDDVVTEILCSDRAVVAIAPHDGGRLVSLELDGAELIGRGTPEAGLPPGWYHGSFPMAPYAGRVKDATFRFDGTTYRLPPNAGPHAGHGLVFDVPWSTVTPSTGSRVVLATPLDGRWPFGGTVEQVVALDGTGLSVTLTLSNDDRPMPGALGFHPWFRRDLGHGPARFSFEPTRRFAPAADGFPRLLSVDLGERPWDDVFTEVRRWPSVTWPGGPTVHIESTSDTWIVYERQESGFCIEPITGPPDSLGTARAAVVRPGEPLVLAMRLDWGPERQRTPRRQARLR